MTYTRSGEEVPGGIVTITATDDPGYEWGELPVGWTLVDETQLPSTGTGTESNAFTFALASMAGLIRAAVVLRMNAYKRA